MILKVLRKSCVKIQNFVGAIICNFSALLHIPFHSFYNMPKIMWSNLVLLNAADRCTTYALREVLFHFS